MSGEPGFSRTKLDPDWPERFYGLRQQLGVEAFGLNQIILQPGQRGRIHRHERQEEVYLIVEGTLTVSIEEGEQALVPGDLIRVPAEVRRQLINRSGERAVFVAIGGAGKHEGRDGEAFPSWEETEGSAPQELPLPEDLQVGER